MRKSVSGWLVVIVVAVMLGAAVRFNFFKDSVPNGQAASAGAPQGPPPVSVLTAAVEIAPALDRIQAVGSLRADESIVVRAEIGGRIATLKFDEGQRVEKGRVLTELNSEEWAAVLRQNEAAVKLQELKTARAAELREKRAISQQEYDETRAALDEARAALALARARLDKTVIRAPFAGILGLRQVSPGDYVEAGQDIVNLEAIDPLKADFGIPERFAVRLIAGLPVEIRVDAYPDEVFHGQVYAIDPRVDPAARRVLLRARIDNPGGRLRPGMFAEVTVVLGRREQALWVPEQAIVPAAGDQFVYRVIEGRAVLTPVRIGIRRPGSVEILTGLAGTDLVVTEGQLKLRDGAPVTIAEFPVAQENSKTVQP